MGRWYRNAFLQYIRVQVRNLIKGISTLMTNNQALYTIPDAGIIYHTPGQENTKPYRMNIHQGVQ